MYIYRDFLNVRICMRMYMYYSFIRICRYAHQSMCRHCYGMVFAERSCRKCDWKRQICMCTKWKKSHSPDVIKRSWMSTLTETCAIRNVSSLSLRAFNSHYTFDVSVTLPFHLSILTFVCSSHIRCTNKIHIL